MKFNKFYNSKPVTLITIANIHYKPVEQFIFLSNKTVLFKNSVCLKS